MAEVSCIIYDLDGTLIDSVADIASALNRLRDHYGLAPLSIAEVRPYIGSGAEKLIERAMFGRVDPGQKRPGQVLPRTGAELRDLVDHFRALYSEDPVVETKLYPGVEYALHWWNVRGTAQAVLTNKPHDITLSIIEHLGLVRVFDVVVGSGREDDMGRVLPGKPNPATIDFILEQTGAPRQETWYVGDGVADIETAANAGVPCVVILGGYTDPEHLVARTQNLDLAVTSFEAAHELIAARLTT